MFSTTRRHFLRQLIGLPLLGGVLAPIVLKGGRETAGERLLMVNGWVVLESDLDP